MILADKDIEMDDLNQDDTGTGLDVNGDSHPEVCEDSKDKSEENYKTA